MRNALVRAKPAYRRMLGNGALHRTKLRHQLLYIAILQLHSQNANRIANKVCAGSKRVGNAAARESIISLQQRDAVAVLGVGMDGIRTGAIL